MDIWQSIEQDFWAAHSFHLVVQPSLRLSVCSLFISRWGNERDYHLWMVSMGQCWIFKYPFFLYSMGKNSVIWPHLTARESTKCTLATFPGEKWNGLLCTCSSLCHVELFALYYSICWSFPLFFEDKDYIDL